MAKRYKRRQRGGIFRGSRKQKGGIFRGSRKQKGGIYRGSRKQKGGIFRGSRKQKGGFFPLAAIPLIMAGAKAGLAAAGVSAAGAVGAHIGNKIATGISGGGRKRRRGQRLKYVGIVKQR